MKLNIRWQTIVQIFILTTLSFMIGSLYGSYAAIGMVMMVLPAAIISYIITWVIAKAINNQDQNEENAEG